MKKQLIKSFSNILAASFLLIIISTVAVEATHFRYGHITFKQRTDLGPNTAEIVVINAFRRNQNSGPGPFTGPDGLPGIGDIIVENQGATRFFYGDGNSTTVLRYEIISIDIANNWMIGRALMPGTTNANLIHTYPSATNGGNPWIGEINSCCRLSSLQNSPNGNYRVYTEIRFDIENESPVSSLPAIVNVPINQVFSFAVPGLDADGDGLTWRFASSLESDITDPIGPAGGSDATNAPTIDTNTGIITWDTNGGTAVGNLFTLQVIIEESRNGVKIGQVAVDFIIEMVDNVATNDPPICAIPQGSSYTVEEGDLLTFDVQASDPNSGDFVLLNSAGLPAGASMTPTLPAGNVDNVSSAFSWQTQTGDAGVYVIVYTATDNAGRQDQCVVNITVEEPGSPPPPPVSDTTDPACQILGINPGPPVNVDVQFDDNESGIRTLEVVRARNAEIEIPKGSGNYYSEGDIVNVGDVASLLVNAVKINNNEGSTIVMTATDTSGNSVTCDPVYSTLSDIAPESFELFQNYPNPFNPTTTIRFNLDRADFVSLKIYDVNGREVRTLFNESIQPGQYAVDWDGTNARGETVAGGIYLYRMTMGNEVITRKMTLIK